MRISLQCLFSTNNQLNVSNEVRESLIAKVVRLVKKIFNYITFQNTSNNAQASTGFFRWKLMAKVALLTAGIGALYFYYNSIQTTPSIKKFGQLSGDEKFELLKRVGPVCKKAVESYCKTNSDGVFCLKDYLSKNWSPFVMAEHNRDLVCDVTVTSPNCSSLVANGGNRLGNHPFTENFEPIPFNPSELSEQDQYALEDFIKDRYGDLKPFKSHIICVHPDQ